MAVVFVLNGFAFASWVSRIPEVRSTLDLSPGRLGTLLLSLSLGAVLALPTAGVWVQRLGVGRVAVGAAAAGLGVPVVWHLVLAAVLVATGPSLVVRRFLPAGEERVRLAGTVLLDSFGRVRVLWATMAVASAGVLLVVWGPVGVLGPWASCCGGSAPRSGSRSA